MKIEGLGRKLPRTVLCKLKVMRTNFDEVGAFFS